MSNISPTAKNSQVLVNPKADPKRPYKAYVTLVVAFLSAFVTSGAPLDIWAKAVIVGVLAAAAAYLAKNPVIGHNGGVADKGQPPLPFD